MPAQKALSPTADHPRILFVDDEPILRTLAVLGLSKYRFDIVTAAGGFEAVDRIRHDPRAWDCVVLDLGMPGMDGRQVYFEIRRIRADLPVVICTGQMEKAVEDLFDGDRRVRVLLKPYPQSNLVQTILDLIVTNRPGHSA